MGISGTAVLVWFSVEMIMDIREIPRITGHLLIHQGQHLFHHILSQRLLVEQLACNTDGWIILVIRQTELIQEI